VVPNKRTENEAVFRAANEQLRARLVQVAEDQRVPFICECSDANCLGTVELALDTYGDIRSQGERRYFVLPGHNGEGEQVVGERDGFLIVEKSALDGS
jgi:hypothetical protein